MKTPPLVAQCRIDTPLGPMTAAATAQGLAGLWFDGQAHHPGPLQVPVDAQQRWLKAAQQAVAAYFEGKRTSLPPLDLKHGTPFQQEIWQALLAVPRGRTTSYAALAVQLGSPSAARAAGAAVGRNPVSVLVPCHRVLGSDGQLTGYAGGLSRKQALLRHEGVAA